MRNTWSGSLFNPWIVRNVSKFLRSRPLNKTTAFPCAGMSLPVATATVANAKSKPASKREKNCVVIRIRERSQGSFCEHSTLGSRIVRGQWRLPHGDHAHVPELGQPQCARSLCRSATIISGADVTDCRGREVYNVKNRGKAWAPWCKNHHVFFTWCGLLSCSCHPPCVRNPPTKRAHCFVLSEE